MNDDVANLIKSMDVLLDGHENATINGMTIAQWNDKDIYLVQRSGTRDVVVHPEYKLSDIHLASARVTVKRMMRALNNERAYGMLGGFEYFAGIGYPTTAFQSSNGVRLRAQYVTGTPLVNYYANGELFHSELLRTELLPKRTTSQMIEHMNSVHREHGPKPPARYNVSANLAYELRRISFDRALDKALGVFSYDMCGARLDHMTTIVQCCKGKWQMTPGMSVIIDEYGNIEFEFAK